MHQHRHEFYRFELRLVMKNIWLILDLLQYYFKQGFVVKNLVILTNLFAFTFSLVSCTYNEPALSTEPGHVHRFTSDSDTSFLVDATNRDVMKIGSPYNYLTGQKQYQTSTCVTLQDFTVASQTSSAESMEHIQISKTSSQILDSFKLGGSASYKTLVYEVHGSLAAAKETAFDAESIVLSGTKKKVTTVKYLKPNQQTLSEGNFDLSVFEQFHANSINREAYSKLEIVDEYKSLVGKDFLKKCGTHFVAEVIYGNKVNVIGKYKASSKKYLNDLNAEAGGSGAGAAINLELFKSKSSQDSKSEFSANIYKVPSDSSPTPTSIDQLIEYFGNFGNQQAESVPIQYRIVPYELIRDEKSTESLSELDKLAFEYYILRSVVRTLRQVQAESNSHEYLWYLTHSNAACLEQLTVKLDKTATGLKTQISETCKGNESKCDNNKINQLRSTLSVNASSDLSACNIDPGHKDFILGDVFTFTDALTYLPPVWLVPENVEVGCYASKKEDTVDNIYRTWVEPFVKPYCAVIGDWVSHEPFNDLCNKTYSTKENIRRLIKKERNDFLLDPKNNDLIAKRWKKGKVKYNCKKCEYRFPDNVKTLWCAQCAKGIGKASPRSYTYKTCSVEEKPCVERNNNGGLSLRACSI